MVSVTIELTIFPSGRGHPRAGAGSERFVLSERRCPTTRLWNRQDGSHSSLNRRAALLIQRSPKLQFVDTHGITFAQFCGITATTRMVVGSTSTTRFCATVYLMALASGAVASAPSGRK